VYSQNNNIIFATNVICFVVPGFVIEVVSRSCIVNIIIKEYAVLCELEPYLVTVNIDLLWCECKALTEIECLTDTHGVFLIVVKDQLGKDCRVTVNWNVFLCKEADLFKFLTGICPTCVGVSDILDVCGVNNCILSNCSACVGDFQLFGSYIVIDVVEETCEGSFIPHVCSVSFNNSSSDLIGAWFCDLFEEEETEIIAVSYLDLQGLRNVDCAIFAECDSGVLVLECKTWSCITCSYACYFKVTE